MSSKLFISLGTVALLGLSTVAYGNWIWYSKDNSVSKPEKRLPSGDCLELICKHGCVEDANNEYLGGCCPSNGASGKACTVDGKDVSACCQEGLSCVSGTCQKSCVKLNKKEDQTGKNLGCCADGNTYVKYNEDDKGNYSKFGYTPNKKHRGCCPDEGVTSDGRCCVPGKVYTDGDKKKCCQGEVNSKKTKCCQAGENACGNKCCSTEVGCNAKKTDCCKEKEVVSKKVRNYEIWTWDEHVEFKVDSTEDMKLYINVSGIIYNDFRQFKIKGPGVDISFDLDDPNQAFSYVAKNKKTYYGIKPEASVITLKAGKVYNIDVDFKVECGKCYVKAYCKNTEPSGWSSRKARY